MSQLPNYPNIYDAPNGFWMRMKENVSLTMFLFTPKPAKSCRAPAGEETALDSQGKREKRRGQGDILLL